MISAIRAQTMPRLPTYALKPSQPLTSIFSRSVSKLCLPIPEKMIGQGENVNQIDSDGESVFSLACCRGDTDFIKDTFEEVKEATLNHPNCHGLTPMDQYIRSGKADERVIVRLLDCGADPFHQAPDGKTLLHPIYDCRRKTVYSLSYRGFKDLGNVLTKQELKKLINTSDHGNFNPIFAYSFFEKPFPEMIAAFYNHGFTMESSERNEELMKIFKIFTAVQTTPGNWTGSLQDVNLATVYMRHLMGQGRFTTYSWQELIELEDSIDRLPSHLIYGTQTLPLILKQGL